VGVRRNLTGGDIENALQRVGADHWRDRPVRTLSAGQKRRVAIAGLALLAAPLWLLDEPTTNLDVDGQKLVGQLIGEQAAHGGAVIAAVHHELSVPAVTVRRLELAGE
jgi:heme exporter protein A